MPGANARGLLVGALAAAIGGALDGCGGSLAGDPGTGGTGGTAPAGAGGGGGDAGAGPAGTTGSGGEGGTAFGEPACPSVIYRGGACTPSDLQLCYTRCGPESTGVRAHTCERNGMYVASPDCRYEPDRDYSCYAIPTVANAACPAGVLPMAASACETDYCTLCNSAEGLPGGTYFDSTGATQFGFCTCRPVNAAGMRVWTCARESWWPCPAGNGCQAPATEATEKR